MKMHLALGLLVGGLGGLVACASTEARPGYDGASSGAPSGNGGGASGDGDAGSSTETPPPNADKPGCAEDAYTETLPTKASLSSLSFSQATANDYLLDALGIRFPLGKQVVEGGLASSISAQQGSCIDRFLQNKTSAQVVLRQASTVVHECGHFYDLGEASGSESAFVIRPGDVTFTCKDGDTTVRNGKTFARSLIKNDSYYAKRKACSGNTPQLGCDNYANVYLSGDPEDFKFDGGDQGYNTVLEEAAQYVNSLATGLAFQDAYTASNASERDGILTFFWYIERYLAMARSDFPEAYKLLSEDACWRQATLTVWDRGWFYLNATKGITKLGIEDAELEELVNEPALRDEIDALRQLECK